MSVDDESLFLTAARMACDAASDLSRRDYLEQRAQHAYALDEPPCELRFGLADRDRESLLQRGAGFSKNLCLLKTQRFGHGPWASQVANAVAAPTFYDKWTRAKFGATPLCGDAARDAALAMPCCPDFAAATFM
jgi:hypothetical protein